MKLHSRFWIFLSVLVGICLGVGAQMLYQNRGAQTKTVKLVKPVKHLPERLRTMPDLRLHYAGITRSMREDKRVIVSLNGLDTPAIVVLASSEKVFWKIEGSTNRLKAIVLSPSNTGSEVTGVPVKVPVMSFAMGRKVMTRVVPSCANPLHGCDDWNLIHGPLLTEIELHLKRFSGRTIESIAVAATAEFLSLPGQKINAKLRRMLAQHDTDIRNRHEIAQKIRQNRYEFWDRYKNEQQVTLANLLARHRPLIFKEIVDQIKLVHVVSIIGGPHTSAWPRPTFLDYSEFKRINEKRRPQVIVRLQDTTPAILVLLSHETVRWRIESVNPTAIHGVYASSREIPLVDNLPVGVPLTIQAGKAGHMKYLKPVNRGPNEQVHKDQISSAFPGVEMRYHNFNYTSVVLIR